jgi:hypothetical protein
MQISDELGSSRYGLGMNCERSRGCWAASKFLACHWVKCAAADFRKIKCYAAPSFASTLFGGCTSGGNLIATSKFCFCHGCIGTQYLMSSFTLLLLNASHTCIAHKDNGPFRSLPNVIIFTLSLHHINFGTHAWSSKCM